VQCHSYFIVACIKRSGSLSGELPEHACYLFVIQALLDIKVYNFKDQVVAISTEATQELALEELLAKVQTKWSGVEFNVMSYKDAKDVFILGGIEDVQVRDQALYM
jgi:hypothetical protein